MVDEVSNIIKESIEQTIGGNSYVHAKVNNWTNSVVESCLASLTKLQKPFKYIGQYSGYLFDIIKFSNRFGVYQMKSLNSSKREKNWDIGTENCCWMTDANFLFVYYFSDVRDHAEERCRSAHGQLVLLGQRHRRQLHRQVGKQNHVLHSLRIRTGYLKKPSLIAYNSDLFFILFIIL